MPALAERPEVDVNATTVLAVARLLREAEGPVSRSWLLRGLSEAGQGTNRPRLTRALDTLFQLGVAVDGSKGVQWTFSASPRLRAARALAREATIEPAPRSRVRRRRR